MTLVDEWSAYLRDRYDVKSIAGVAGVGLAGPEVIAYVERITPELMREIPEELNGLEVKVKETGPFRILPLVTYPALSRTDIFRPAPGGVSIGHFLGETGTHGCSVKPNEGGVAGFSNNHVCGLRWGDMMEGSPGDIILQPGLADYSGPGNELGELLRTVDVPPYGSGISSVDGALYTGDFAQEIIGLGIPSYSVRMEPGMLIAKSGRTTGVTLSYVESIGAVIDVEGFGIAPFENVAITDRAFSMGGDSGSIALDSNAQTAGAVFAGSNSATALCEAVELESQLHFSFGWTEPHSLNLELLKGFSLPSVTWLSTLVGATICYYVAGRNIS